ncbi:hypothetical protein FOA43_004692 [Brettanomyces nanus]|uniref:Uncharacterized protein n=1 Tax=Eeniella nana TaxID=13502 RepID=A0A875SFA6_EENNA|nr:uncharacterized protein FOA43_004692 [Brettanomyces nanus]QPG77284.1 hypothetical protein FOA43_004692 [Brettanomyces nanus]
MEDIKEIGDKQPEISESTDPSSGTFAVEHAKVYRELVCTLDKLIEQTIQTRNQTDNAEMEAKYKNAMNEFGDVIKLGTIQKGTSSIKFLQSMVDLRLKILEQHLMTEPILEAIRKGDTEDESRQLIQLINTRDSKNIQTIREMKRNTKLRKELGTTRLYSIDKLELLRDKMKYYLKLCADVRQLQEKSDSMVGNVKDYDLLKSKYKSLVRKDQILSQFNVNLVSSLSNSDIADDHTLRDIVMFCGDYSHYGLFEL